jgi:osmotically-inducible protein OsmY
MPRTEELIKRDVIDQLAWDTRINANRVEVSVDDHTVILGGSVPSYGSRIAAEADARAVFGVTDVENNLTVTYPTAVPVPSDGEIHSNINNVLLWDPELDATRVNVSVQNGRVTLEGSVDALWKKIEAENRVANISGVLTITNKLAVVPNESFADEVIGEDVENALDRNTLVNVDEIDVKVENGVVTLYGSVPAWTVDQAAYTTALYTDGVIDVNDNLRVSTP